MARSLGRGGGPRRPRRLNVGCWNMRTLVESDGSIATGVARRGGRGVAIDRKASLMVQELRKFGMSVVCISETKWFGSAVYDIDGYLILHSGRPVPGEGVKVERNEGMAIVLDPCMVKNWKDGGEVWEPVSSRVVSARLKLSDGLEGRVSGKKCPVYCSVVSVYTPTHRASQEDKDYFFDDLQRVLDGISADDVLLIMGDLNARVGAEDDGGAWDGVCGRHGVGCRNESGEALLSWCALNGLVVMNTMFEKKKIHKYTWQHPASKQWHCIDYVIMRQRQRGLCCDVSVLRVADCWTDHKLLRAQLRVGCRVVKKASAVTRRRFAVGALQDEMMRKAFVEKVCGTVESCWDDGLSGAGMWEVIRDGMVSAAESVLGWETRKVHSH